MANTAYDFEKVIFISGLHRSGTSILFKCLKDHKDLCGFENTGQPQDEGQFLQSVYPPAFAYGGPGQFGFNKKAALNGNSILVNPKNRMTIINEWSKHIDLKGRYFVEKSPPNILKSLFLQALFPESYFILIKRHPIAVSYATQKWSNTSIYSLIKHWLVCHEKFNHDKQHLNKYIEIKYEDFVNYPTKVLNSIYRFIGIEVITQSQDISRTINNHYFDQWRKDKNKFIFALYSKLIIYAFEKRVNNFGYSLINLHDN